MNQQIKTSFGVMIILIIAVTAGVFVWLSQKNNPIETETQTVKFNPIENQPNETAGLKVKTEKERCENIDENNVEQSEACSDYYARLDEAQKNCASIDNKDTKKLEECYNYYGLTTPMNNENKYIDNKEISAKIVAPKQVSPVVYQGIQYESPNEKAGYVLAINEETGEKLWERKVYEQVINPDLEEDVQWVFIADLKIEEKLGETFLIVINDKGDKYKADISEKIKIPSFVNDVLGRKITTLNNQKPMQKPMNLILIIILAVLVLPAGGYLGYKYYRQNRDKIIAEVIETRDFSCPGMSGFTFKYPVFKDWEVTPVQNGCVFSLNSEVANPGDVPEWLSTVPELMPYIFVSEIKMVKNSDFWFEPEPGNVVKLENPNQVPYLPFPFRGEEYQFVKFNLGGGNGAEVSLRLGKVEFDKKAFFKTVIESFRLTDQNYVIFPAEYENQEIEKENTKRFTPTDLEAQNTLSILGKFLKDKKELKSLDSYKTQLFGYINEKGEKIIRGNYFCSNQSDWKSKIVYVLDGGNCYFQAEVNLDKQEVSRFTVNGEA